MIYVIYMFVIALVCDIWTLADFADERLSDLGRLARPLYRRSVALLRHTVSTPKAERQSTLYNREDF